MIAKKLLKWYDAHGRKLPWRDTRDPYRILVSEIMLQQTQVPRVIPFYRSWLKQFPTWNVLAHADTKDLLRAWSGLGYNRRALALQSIAKQVVERGVPDSAEAWLELKGIGPYTSAALACFSLHEKVFPVDTNIRRVAGRVLFGKPFPQPSDDARILSNASSFMLQASRFYDVPQALFDLASSVCLKEPACAACPLRDACKAAPAFLRQEKMMTPRVSHRVNKKKAIERIHAGKKYPDRIYRGRILRLVVTTKRGVAKNKIGKLVDPTFDVKKDGAWMQAMLTRMGRDGLVRFRNQRVIL